MKPVNMGYLILGFINGYFLGSSAWHHQTGFVILFSFIVLVCFLGAVARFRE